MATIITKNSSTAAAVPTAGQLVQGELAVNVTDKKVYTKDASAAVVKLVGSLGNQESNNVTITGGTITGTTVSGSANINVQRFSGDGTTTVFTLSSNPLSENNTQIYINGVYQQKDTYTVVGTTLTFSEAPVADTDNIEVVTTSMQAIGTTTSDLVSYTPAGTGAVDTTVQTKLRESVSVKDFGAIGDGVTDDTAAIQAAITGAGTNKRILFPEGVYVLSSTLNLTSANNGIKFIGDGTSATTIKKSFSGNLISLTSCSNFELSEVTVDGQFGTYTGKCVTLSGTSNYPIFHNLITTGFSGNHIEFAANSGFGADIFNHQATLGVGQTSCVGVALSGRDTGYSVRRITSCSYAGSIDLSAGCDNVFIISCQFTSVSTSSLCSNLFIQGCRWGNAGVAISIFGNTIVMGCSFAQSITLESGFDGAFIGNKQTGGSLPYFTNNSIGCQIYHLDPSGLFHVNKAKLEYQKTGEIEICNSNTLGDVSYSYVFGASPAIVLFSTPLTANRTITLPTTGGRAGTRVRFVRNAGDTGGPWTFSVGATGKTLSANSWCDVLFNGSFWVVTGAGSL